MTEGDVKSAETLAAEAKAVEDKKLADITEGVRKNLHAEYERKMDDFKKEMAGKFATPVQKDEITLIKEDLDQKVKAGTVTASDFVDAQLKIAEITSDKKFRASADKTTSVNAKIAEFAVEHPDVYEMQTEMLSELKKLSPEKQAFIQNSPPEVGIEFLYNKVALEKAKTGGFFTNKDQGSSLSGRSSSSKGDKSASQGMAEALKNGDKAAFDKYKELSRK